MIEVRAHNTAPVCQVVHQYKVFSGAAPFADSTPTSVTARVLLGERPERPKVPNLTNGLWDLIQRCLGENPRGRPEITEVVRELRRAIFAREDFGLPSATPSGLRPPTSTNASRLFPFRLRRRRKLNKPSSESESTTGKAGCVKYEVAGFSTHRVKLRGLPTPTDMQSVSHRSRGLLQRAGFWLSNCGLLSAQDRHNRPDSPSEKQGATDPRGSIS